jgi:pimeloyl-ACP methyl ester carboxylesterase
MIAPLLALAVGAGALPLAPCVLETAGMGRTEAMCGAVFVEDEPAAGGAGGKLDIAIAILQATGPKKLPDPVVVLPGGPGQGATELAAVLRLGLRMVQRERDIILFDPRGTGRSHKLHCPDERDLPERLRASEEDVRARLLACVTALEEPTDGVVRPALRSITTARIAADLEEVRRALGVERWNLVGVSYGTRLALAYDRAFPGRARTLTLDGPAPFSMVVGEDASADALRALEALDKRCQETAGCGARDLVGVVTRLRASLDAAPREVTVPHPVRGAPSTLRMDGKTALSAIQHLLYTEESAALLPPLLAAATAGDLGPLAAQLFGRERVEDTVSQPMQLSILCAEDAPFFSRERARSAKESPFPDMREELKEACALWPHAEVPASFKDDLPATPTPALILVGTADPITPPRGATALRATLPNNHTVIGQGVGHNLLFRGCVPDLVHRFIQLGRVDELDASCAADLGPFPLFIDALGPAP